MTFSWEPGEFDTTFFVSGTLSVASTTGEKVLGYQKPVSVSAANQRDAKAKVKMMLLSRDGLTEASITGDFLEVTATS